MREQIKQIIREYYLLHILKDGYTEENETLVVDKLSKLFEDNKDINILDKLKNDFIKHDNNKPTQPNLIPKYGIIPNPIALYGIQPTYIGDDLNCSTILTSKNEKENNNL